MEETLPSAHVQVRSWDPPWPLNVILAGYSYETFFMTLVVVALLTLLFWALTRRLRLVPGRRQALAEIVVTFLRDVVYGTLGPKDGRKFLPLIGTIFLFVWASNMVGLLPTADIFSAVNGILGRDDGTTLVVGIADGGLAIPGAAEPSRNVNFPWGLGIMMFFLMHGIAIHRKGMAAYLNELFEPHLGGFTVPYQKWRARIAMAAFGFAAAGAFGYALGSVCDGPWGTAPWAARGFALALGLYAAVCFLAKPKFQPKRVGIPNIFMAPLNIVGKLSEILSMCFRLFGNIFGGAIIIAMIGSAIRPVMPVLLQAFFGIFVGTVQAFVFAVLCLTYLAVEIREEEDDQADATAVSAAATAPT